MQKNLPFANILDNKSLIVFQIDNIARNTGTLLGSRTDSLFTFPFLVLLLSCSDEFIKGYPGQLMFNQFCRRSVLRGKDSFSIDVIDYFVVKEIHIDIDAMVTFAGRGIGQVNVAEILKFWWVEAILGAVFPNDFFGLFQVGCPFILLCLTG